MTPRERNIKIFVGNLPFDATEDDLRPLLHGVGQIRYISIRKDPVTNRSRGYAHVEYRTEPECVEAIKRLQGKEIKGRPLKVDFCEEIYRDKYPELVTDSIFVKEKQLAQANAEQKYQHQNIPQPSVPLPPPPPPPPPIIPIQPIIQVTPPIVQVPQHPLVQVNQPQILPPPPPKPTQPRPEVIQEPKRPRSEQEVLLHNGKVVNKDLFQLIKKMSMLDVYKLVKKIDSLMEKSPNTARSILNSNPHIRSALVHAKLLLGYKGLDLTNLTKVDIANILDYFVIH